MTKESPVSNRLVTDVMLIFPTEGLLLVPGQQHVADKHDKPVAQKPQHADAQHRRDHDVVAVKQIPIDSRTPVRIDGNAAGRITRDSSSRSFAPIILAALYSVMLS